MNIQENVCEYEIAGIVFPSEDSLMDQIPDSTDAEFWLEPVVSIEAFFRGNNHGESIARNLSYDHPGLQFIKEHLEKIRKREDVEDVVVEISHIEVFEGSNQYLWPYSNRFYIITNASQEKVSKWVEPLMINDIEEGWGGREPACAPRISEGNKVYNVSWR